MNKFAVLCIFATIIAMTFAQFQQQFGPPQPNPNLPGFNQPNINDLCSRPGANCNINTRFAEESSFTDHKGNTQKFTRVCDDRGCYERKLSNGSSALSTSFLLISLATIVVSIKTFIH